MRLVLKVSLLALALELSAYFSSTFDLIQHIPLVNAEVAIGVAVVS